jgi:hypothetical protein
MPDLFSCQHRRYVLKNIKSGPPNLAVLGYTVCNANNFQISSSISYLGCELTGDTVVFGKGVWGDAKKAQIM